jgi:hypothetical protein
MNIKTKKKDFKISFSTWTSFPKSSKCNLSFLGKNISSLTCRNCLISCVSFVDVAVFCPLGK